MVRDKNKGPKKNKDPTMKELDELEDRINILEYFFSKFGEKKEKQKDDEPSLDPDTSLDGSDFSDTDSCNESGDSSQNLINFMVGRDLDWQFPRFNVCNSAFIFLL
ncbi:hypothetical protein Tco_1278236 [Tanacetum coccineum]